MIRNKYILTPFLMLAWVIIFAHSVIPHHHHSEGELSECNHCKEHQFHVTQFNDCQHDCHSHACHFHVEILTKVNFDQGFLYISENNFNFNININKTNNIDFYRYFISGKIPKTTLLRGPPAIIS